MSEGYLTMAEIEATYPNEWVLIANPTKKRKTQQVTGGHVVIHCADRVEYWRLLGEWDDPQVKELATQYVGKFPEDEDVMLPIEPALSQQ